MAVMGPVQEAAATITAPSQVFSIIGPHHVIRLPHNFFVH